MVSLLALLNLPPPRSGAARRAPGLDAAAVSALGADIQAREKKLRANHQTALAARARFEQAIASAQGAHKAELEGRNAQLDDYIGNCQRELEQIDKDVEKVVEPMPADVPAVVLPQAPPTPEQTQVLDDRRKEFKRARAAWVAVKARAEQDLEKVKDGAHMAYLRDVGQFPKIVAGCKAIDDILDHLDDELRDTLDQYASTPLRDQRKLQALAATATEVLERYQQFVAGNKLMRAIDEKEFADVAVHAPVTKALRDLRKALG